MQLNKRSDLVLITCKSMLIDQFQIQPFLDNLSQALGALVEEEEDQRTVVVSGQTMRQIQIAKAGRGTLQDQANTYPTLTPPRSRNHEEISFMTTRKSLEALLLDSRMAIKWLTWDQDLISRKIFFQSSPLKMQRLEPKTLGLQVVENSSPIQTL